MFSFINFIMVQNPSSYRTYEQNILLSYILKESIFSDQRSFSLPFIIETIDRSIFYHRVRFEFPCIMVCRKISLSSYLTPLLVILNLHVVNPLSFFQNNAHNLVVITFRRTTPFFV